MKAQFSPHDYVLARGWDHFSIIDTAAFGVSSADEETLISDECEKLLAWCKQQADEQQEVQS